jgi:hypothetical protein
MPRVSQRALARFFRDDARAARIHAAVERAIDRIGPASERVSKSQVAFRRRVGFAWTWLPRRYLGARGAALALSITLNRRDGSSRWKEVVQIAPGRFMHHLEMTRVTDVDAEVRTWLAEAWKTAG